VIIRVTGQNGTLPKRPQDKMVQTLFDTPSFNLTVHMHTVYMYVYEVHIHCAVSGVREDD